MPDEWDQYGTPANSVSTGTGPTPAISSTQDEWDQYAAPAQSAAPTPGTGLNRYGQLDTGAELGPAPTLPKGVVRDANGAYGSVAPPSDASLLWRAVTNPVGEGQASGITGGLRQIGGQAIKAIADTPGAVLNAVEHPIADQILPTDEQAEAAVKNLYQSVKQGNPLPAENAIGATLGGIEAGRMGAGLLDATKAAGTGIKNWRVPPTSSVVVPDQMQAGARVARAVGAPGVIAPEEEEALAAQTPSIKEYAARTNNPLNTRWEFAKAAEGHGQEFRDLWKNEILGPSADHVEDVSDIDYGGKESAPGKATLADIDQRISDINHDLVNDYKAPNEAKQFTGEQTRALRAEAAQLREKLITRLSQESGLNPDDIKFARNGYGQSRAIDQMTDYARRAQPSDPSHVPHTKYGLYGEIVNKGIRGGADPIADRTLRNALNDERFPVQQNSPVPQLASRAKTGYGANQARAAAQQAAAQQEVLHANDLAQGQEQLAAQKSAGSQARQAASTASNRAAAQQEVLHAHDLQSGAQDASAARARQAAIERDAIRNQTGALPEESANPDQAKMEEYVESGDPRSFKQWMADNEEPVQLSDADRARLEVDAVNQGVKPNTHDFSISRWKKANPDGDVAAHISAAKDLGYRIRP